MKKYLLVGLVLTSLFLKAQEAEKVSVEKKLYGFQLSFFGSGFQYETRLDRKITLLSEIGLTLVLSTKEFEDPAIKDKTTTLFAPYLSVEPRWYYGLDRRNKMGRNTNNNSSNYVSILTSFISTKTPVIKNGDLNITPTFLFIPKYGIRRAFAKNFNYEFSGGYGLQYNVFSKANPCNCEHLTTNVNFEARIGYNF